MLDLVQGIERVYLRAASTTTQRAWFFTNDGRLANNIMHLAMVWRRFIW